MEKGQFSGQISKVINGQELTFLRHKALWQEEEGMLLIADTHFGKARHFRKGGIPIPENIHESDFALLAELIRTNKARKVVFLGDLFHSDWNTHWQVLEHFMKEFSQVSFELVKGNHDILQENIYAQSLLTVHHHPIQLGAFLLSHEPVKAQGLVNICGHLHPGIRLSGRAKQRLKFPCFYLSEDRIVLPAFGSFTGTMEINSFGEGIAYAVVSKKLLQINLS